MAGVNLFATADKRAVWQGAVTGLGRPAKDDAESAGDPWTLAAYPAHFDIGSEWELLREIVLVLYRLDYAVIYQVEAWIRLEWCHNQIDIPVLCVCFADEGVHNDQGVAT